MTIDLRPATLIVGLLLFVTSALAGPAPSVVLSASVVSDADAPKAQGVTSLAKNRFSSAALIVSFGGKKLRDVVGGLADSSLEDALVVTIAASPESKEFTDFWWPWTFSDPNATVAVLPLSGLWPGKSGAGSTFPQFLDTTPPGHKLTFSVNFRQLFPTGGKVERYGQLVAETVWKTRGPATIASVTVEVAPLDVALPAADTFVKAVAASFDTFVATKFPVLDRNADLDAGDWQSPVNAKLDDVCKALRSEVNCSTSPAQYADVQRRASYSDLHQVGEPACSASSAPGFLKCKWKAAARLEIPVMVQEKPSGAAKLFGGGKPGPWKPKNVGLDCTWTVQARVDDKTLQLGAQQDWWGTECTVVP